MFSKTFNWKFTSPIVVTWGIRLSYSSWSCPCDATLYAWDILLCKYIIILLNISWLYECGTTIYMPCCFQWLNMHSLLKCKIDKSLVLLMLRASLTYLCHGVLNDGQPISCYTAIYLFIGLLLISFNIILMSKLCLKGNFHSMLDFKCPH